MQGRATRIVAGALAALVVGCLAGPARASAILGRCRLTRSPARWLAVALLMAWGGSALGSPFYHVTDLGDWADSLDSRNQLYEISHGWAAGPDHILTNRATGVSYAVSKEPAHVRTSGELPGTWGTQGVLYPQPVYWTMKADQSNAHGLVVGDLPNGTSRADPWGSTYTYYALLGEDGTYRVAGNLSQMSTFTGGSMLSSFTTDINAKNQILVYRWLSGSSFYSNPADWKPFDYHPPGGLLDTATGVVTDLNQILPPGVRLATVGGLNLLDDGSVLGPADLGDGTFHLVLLTPPDQPPPQPVPEPSSVVVFAALGLLGAGFSAIGRRRRAEGCGTSRLSTNVDIRSAGQFAGPDREAAIESHHFT